MITIEDDDLCATSTTRGTEVKIEHNQNGEEYYNFEIVAILDKDQASLT